MTQIKFKTPIAMKCTQEQYDRDLKQPLKELGYVENDMDRCGNSYNTLSTNWLSIHNYLGVRKEFNNTHLIPTYNPKLYIALAGMTVGEDWIVGEWLVYGDVLFKVTSISNGRKNYKKGFATNDKDAKIVYRKATKEELIEHFTEDVEEQPMQQEPKKDRFPFALSLEEAKRIIKVAPTIYKIVLAQEWGENLILDGNIKVTEEFYSKLRNTCNDINLVLDEIFGKDEEFIPDGTPCLVRGYEDWGWNLRYADGKGEFYCDGFKYGNPKKWKYYQVLDINNLPVNE